jgi:hypothetical protein
MEERGILDERILFLADEDKIARADKNIWDRIYCRKTKASTSFSKLSPSKYDPSDCMR